MPTYDYECKACGHRFELFQSMSAKVRRKCPGCGQPKLERLIGPGAGFLFKGEGFYITDYRSDSYKAGQKAAEEKPASTEKTDKTDKASSDAGSGGGSAGSAAKKDGKAGSTKRRGAAGAKRKE